MALEPQTPSLIADMVERKICCGIRRPFLPESIHEAARRANLAAGIERLPGAYPFTESEGKRIFPADSVNASPRRACFGSGRKSSFWIKQSPPWIILGKTYPRKKPSRECGATVVSIAHRPSTLRDCDEIIVMDKGLIV